VEMDSMVPFGFVFGSMRTAMEVAKTWKLLNDGATAKVLVEAVTVIVWVEAFALLSTVPAWNPYTVAVDRLEMTRVVLVSPASLKPTEELETLKWPDVPVEIIIRVFAGFPFLPKVTDMDVVNIWYPTRVGGAARVVVEISVPATL